MIQMEREFGGSAEGERDGAVVAFKHPEILATERVCAKRQRCAPLKTPHALSRDAAARKRRAGFTVIELLVVVGLVTALIALLIPMLSKARASSQSVTCLANLRHITLAFNLYAGDNRQQFPLPSDVSKQSWETVLRAYLSAREVYHCPSDGGVFEQYGSSYDWRDTGDPDSTAAGKFLSEIGRSNLVFAFDALPDWHARGRVNAALLDGSASSMPYQDCLRELDSPLGR